jgi:hypothetical protein
VDDELEILLRDEKIRESDRSRIEAMNASDTPDFEAPDQAQRTFKDTNEIAIMERITEWMTEHRASEIVSIVFSYRSARGDRPFEIVAQLFTHDWTDELLDEA